jgi:hypothetical protein
MLKPLFTAAFVLIAASSVAATAHAASHDRNTFIREQDLDGDGKVSKDEFAAGRDKEFARMDANHDGWLSHDEYVSDFKTRLEVKLPTLPADKREEERAREMRQVEVRFGVLDTDKNGKITPAEFAYSGWMMFAHHDTNKDGFVSKDDPIAKDDN